EGIYMSDVTRRNPLASPPPEYRGREKETSCTIVCPRLRGARGELQSRRMGWRPLCTSLVLALATAQFAMPTPVAAQAATTPKTQQLVTNPTLNRVEILLRKGDWQRAHDELVPWLKAEPKAPDRDRGLFLLAQVYYQGGDRIRAFYHLDELLDNFPESKLYFPALELQFDIADAYLKGYKEKFWGLPIVGHEDEAIEMLYRIQERSPGSSIAERALKRTADYYFNTSQFDLSADAYGVFATSYPRSPDVPQAKLRQAFSNLAQFRGPRYDATPLIDARAQFKAVQAQYPDLGSEA